MAEGFVLVDERLLITQLLAFSPRSALELRRKEAIVPQLSHTDRELSLSSAPGLTTLISHRCFHTEP